jgi:hypothetical protein
VIETFAPQQVELPIVTPVSLRLTRWPAVAAKARRAFSLGAVVVTVTGSPPATIVVGTLPVTLRVLTAPPAAAERTTVRGPSAVGVTVPE